MEQQQHIDRELASDQRVLSGLQKMILQEYSEEFFGISMALRAVTRDLDDGHDSFWERMDSIAGNRGGLLLRPIDVRFSHDTEFSDAISTIPTIFTHSLSSICDQVNYLYQKRELTIHDIQSFYEEWVSICSIVDDISATSYTPVHCVEQEPAVRRELPTTLVELLQYSPDYFALTQAERRAVQDHGNEVSRLAMVGRHLERNGLISTDDEFWTVLLESVFRNGELLNTLEERFGRDEQFASAVKSIPFLVRKIVDLLIQEINELFLERQLTAGKIKEVVERYNGLCKVIDRLPICEPSPSIEEIVEQRLQRDPYIQTLRLMRMEWESKMGPHEVTD